MIIGILGYFTIPTVAGWIIQAGGGTGNYNRHVNTAGALVGGVAGAAAGNVAGRAGRGAMAAGRYAKKGIGKIFGKK